MSGGVTQAYIGDIVKSYRDEEGDLIVYGKAAGPDLDLDGERCDPNWLRREVPSWFEWGNVREQHSQIAAGVGIEIENTDDDWHIKAKVTDKNTAHKVETGTLKGWSLGAIDTKTYKDARGQTWLTGGKIVEFSLVDRPCNPTTTLAVAKSAGDGDWSPVSSAGEVIASLRTKAVKLDLPRGAAGSQKAAADAEDQAPAFDRALALSIAAAVMKKDRAGALKLIEPLTAKAVTAGGVQDEAPDIAGGKQVLELLAQLIAAEASELGAGYLDETCDIQILLQAVDCVKWWLSREQAGAETLQEPFAGPEPEPEIVYVALDAEPDTTKAAPTQTSSLDEAAVQKIAKAAAVEATKAAQAEIESLRGELAQIKSTAIPGGPFVVAPPVAATGDTAATKAAGYRAIAKTASDPTIREAYNALAAQTEQAARR